MPSMPDAPLQMHNDHREWVSDESRWREELTCWRRDLDEVRRDPRSLEYPIADFSKDLDAYTVSLQRQRTAMAVHEHALVQFEREQGDDRLQRMAQLHQKYTDRHAELQAAHHRLKARRHLLVSHWRKLVGTHRLCDETSTPAAAAPATCPLSSAMLVGTAGG